MKQGILAIAAGLVLSGSAAASNEQVIAVWNGVAPGSETWTYTEESTLSEPDKTSNFRNIVTPTITVYPAAHPNGTAVLVIPGGRFVNNPFGKEGEEPARWLNTIDVTAFVLKYRTVHIENGVVPEMDRLIPLIDAHVPLATADTLQALKVIRARAQEWSISKLGIVGFSAGGQLGVNAALAPEAAARPDFFAGLYAAAFQPITATPTSPPVFLALAEDDRNGTDWSLRIYKAWHDAQAPVEMHIYAKGDHGFALRKTGIPTDHWPDRLKEWLSLMGFLPAPATLTASPGR